MIFSTASVTLRRFSLATLLLTSAATMAQAQTAGQLVEDTYAPPVIRQGVGGVALPATTGLETPDGAEGLHVVPSGLVVEGGLAALSSQTAEIAARLTGMRVTGADLFAAARDLETAYAQAGYLLVRVSLPPQTIRDGHPLRLVVTDGHVENIDASALPEGARGRVEDVLQSLVGRKGLERAELERRLLLAGDVPGVTLRSTLKAGRQPGGAVIVVDGRYDATTFTAAVDNAVSRDLGRFSVTLGADLNNRFGLGEVVYARLSGYPDLDGDFLSGDPRNRQIVAGFTLPLGLDGLWFGLEGVDGRTHPTSDLGYTMPNHFQRLSTRLGYNWIRSRTVNTGTILSFDIIREAQTIDLGGIRLPWSEDQLRVLRIQQDIDASTAWGAAVSGSARLSFGLDGLGAREASLLLPLSRDGATPDFAKLDLSARYSQSLLQDRMLLSLSGRAQTSFGDPLVSSEQMGLGGFDGLSAFGSGDLQGDAGVMLRSELSFPVSLSSAETTSSGGALAPYVFAAAGIAVLEQPTALEERVTRAVAYGAGLRFAVPGGQSSHSAGVTLEYARGVASKRDQRNRFNLRFLAAF